MKIYVKIAHLQKFNPMLFFWWYVWYCSIQNQIFYRNNVFEDYNLLTLNKRLISKQLLLHYLFSRSKF